MGYDLRVRFKFTVRFRDRLWVGIRPRVLQKQNRLVLALIKLYFLPHCCFLCLFISQIKPPVGLSLPLLVISFIGELVETPGVGTI